MPTHRAFRVPSPGAFLEVASVVTESPPPGHVRIDVAACGVCGTDSVFVNGAFPGLSWPLTPGHEIAGTLAEAGAGVSDFAVGDRVVVGWFGGHCARCVPCRSGDFIHCENGQRPGREYPGGYAESVTVPANALARIPGELSFSEAAPMSCAGVTTYNALRHASASPGDRVAVLGIGGLGHLGVQFARAMGFETVAIARGAEKEETARELGAHHYIDSTAGDVPKALQALGGVSVVLATPASSAAISQTVGGLRPRGELAVISLSLDPMPIIPIQLVGGELRVTGYQSGTPRETEETMHFAMQSGVRAWIQERPLAEAADAYAAMHEGRARYRIVLTV